MNIMSKFALFYDILCQFDLKIMQFYAIRSLFQGSYVPMHHLIAPIEAVQSVIDSIFNPGWHNGIMALLEQFINYKARHNINHYIFKSPNLQLKNYSIGELT